MVGSVSDHARMALCGRHIAQPDHEVLVESNSKDWPHSQQRSLKPTKMVMFKGNKGNSSTITAAARIAAPLAPDIIQAVPGWLVHRHYTED